MSIEWYRVYHGMPEDAKLKVIAKRCDQLMTHVVTVWLCVLDAASRHKTRGTVQVDSEQIAVVQDIDQPIVESILRAFYEKGMIDQKHRLTGWDKRQYATSTERSQKSRADKQHDATPCNTTQRDAADGNVTQRKNSKKTPDTENRIQIADAENRSTDGRPDSDAEAETEKKTNSDKKLRVRAEKRESEREKQTSCGLKNQNRQILEQMLGIWNAEVQSKLTPDQKAKLTPKRQQQMAQRWLEDFQQDMRAWKHYCEIIGASEFCLGKIAGKGWTIDLSWAVESSDHVAKILEGGFSGGNHPPKPPTCDVPALQEAWDQVLDAFHKKYGKAAGRSWLSRIAVTRILKYGDGAVVTMRCPSKFIQEWLTQYYLTDLTRWFAEATKHDAPVTRIEFITEASV
jgi:hypothetical protein